MAVNLSFIGGAGWQFFDNDGVPLAGGKIYTYAAGTSTPQATYTSRDGLTANANPIILDAAGRTPQQIWSTEGLLYKYVVADTNDVIIRTWDNIGGSVVASDLAQNLASTSNNAYGDALIGFKQSGPSGFLTGAVARTVNDKLQESISVKDFGATGDGNTDDTAAILAACTAAQGQGVQNVLLPAGTYVHTTLDLTDMSIRFIGDGVNSTTLKYIGSNTSDGIKFGTSQNAYQKVYGCGLQQLTVDGNSLARRAVEITSVYGAVFDTVRILSPFEYGMYWTCLPDRLRNATESACSGTMPSDNQRCTINDLYVECVCVPTAVAIFFDGNAGTGATVAANTSLNNFQNIRLNIRNGDGIVFGFADANTLMGCWIFRPSTNTGRGIVFSADDSGQGRYARNNNCWNIQTARAGVYALAGTGTQPSEDNYVFLSVGNGTVNFPPTIEAGAKMSWQNEYMMVNYAGYKSVFVSGGSAVSAAATAIAQIPLVTTESVRVYNGSDNHILLTNNNDDTLADKWGVNIVNSSGDLRFSRTAGTGNIEAAYLVKTSNVSRAVSTYTSSGTLTNTQGVVLVDATSANVQITLPLANTYGTGRSPNIQIRRIDASANTVTVVRQGSDTLNGGTSETLAASTGKTYVCNAVSAWYSL